MQAPEPERARTPPSPRRSFGHASSRSSARAISSSSSSRSAFAYFSLCAVNPKRRVAREDPRWRVPEAPRPDPRRFAVSERSELSASAPPGDGGAAVSSRCANPVPAREFAPSLSQSARRSSLAFSGSRRAAGESNGPPRRSANGVPVATALTLARARARGAHAGARIGRGRLRVLPGPRVAGLGPRGGGSGLACRASRPARARSRGRRPARRRRARAATGRTRAVRRADRASTAVGTNASLCRGRHTDVASSSRRCQDAFADANGTKPARHVMALRP